MGPKRIKLADPGDTSPNFDWSLCCLCQKSGDLICPKRKTNKSDTANGYATLAFSHHT